MKKPASKKAPKIAASLADLAEVIQTAPAPVEGTAPAPVEGTAPAPAEGTAPAPAPVEGTAPAPAPVEGTAPAPVEGTAPAPTIKEYSEAEKAAGAELFALGTRHKELTEKVNSKMAGFWGRTVTLRFAGNSLNGMAAATPGLANLPAFRTARCIIAAADEYGVPLMGADGTPKGQKAVQTETKAARAAEKVAEEKLGTPDGETVDGNTHLGAVGDTQTDGEKALLVILGTLQGMEDDKGYSLRERFCDTLIAIGELCKSESLIRVKAAQVTADNVAKANAARQDARHADNFQPQALAA